MAADAKRSVVASSVISSLLFRPAGDTTWFATSRLTATASSPRSSCYGLRCAACPFLDWPPSRESNPLFGRAKAPYAPPAWLCGQHGALRAWKDRCAANGARHRTCIYRVPWNYCGTVLVLLSMRRRRPLDHRRRRQRLQDRAQYQQLLVRELGEVVFGDGP